MSLTKRLAALLVITSAALFAQEGQIVNQSEGPPINGWTSLYFYDGSNNLTYICSTRSAQSSATLAITQIVDSGTTATVTTAAAHGLAVGNRVTIAGVTGDTDLNGTYVITAVGATTTFTYTSASVTDTTYNNAGITAATTAPRTTQPIWSINRKTYATNLLTASQWAVKTGASGAAGGTGTQNICDNRAASTQAYE